MLHYQGLGPNRPKQEGQTASQTQASVLKWKKKHLFSDIYLIVFCDCIRASTQQEMPLQITTMTPTTSKVVATPTPTPVPQMRKSGNTFMW